MLEHQSLQALSIYPSIFLSVSICVLVNMWLIFSLCHIVNFFSACLYVFKACIDFWFLFAYLVAIDVNIRSSYFDIYITKGTQANPSSALFIGNQMSPIVCPADPCNHRAQLLRNLPVCAMIIFSTCTTSSLVRVYLSVCSKTPA